MNRRTFLGLGLSAAVWPTLGRAALVRPERARLRELGIVIGELATGPYNAITDVEGVQVGHLTLIEDGGPDFGETSASSVEPLSRVVRTGVTAIVPRTPSTELRSRPAFAADFTLNGNGELMGVGSMRRTGLLAGPVLFTNTSSVGAVYDGAVEWMLARDPDLFKSDLQPAPIVGETWAAFLHDEVGRHVQPAHAVAALDAVRDGPVAEGCVGGGTGMRAYSFKAGIGTASRKIPCGDQVYTVGVLVQANFGRRPQLRVDGVPVGREITDLMPVRGGKSKSMIAAVATDAPLIPIQLQRVCKRVALGMARTGAISTQGSGDLWLAFSTASPEPPDALAMLSDRWISGLFQGVIEATEEAILNSLTTAHTMTGRGGNTIHALPLDRLVEIMRAYGRLK